MINNLKAILNVLLLLSVLLKMLHFNQCTKLVF